MAEKQYELPENPSGIAATGGRLNLTNASDYGTPSQVGFVSVPTIQNPIGEFTKEILPDLVTAHSAKVKQEAKAAEEASKAKTLNTFAKILIDFHEAPENQELNPFEKQHKLDMLTLRYVGDNLKYAESLSGIKELVKLSNEQADGRFIKVEEGGVSAIDAHGNHKFYAKDMNTFIQQSTARAISELPPSIVTSISEKYKDDPVGLQTALGDEVLRKATMTQVADSAKMMDDKVKLVNGNDEMRYRTFQKTTIPILNHDIAEDLDKSIKVLKSNLNNGMHEDVALAKFKDDYEHTIHRPDIKEMFYGMNKGDEYTKFADGFKNYIDIAGSLAKGLDKKNKLQYDETVDRAKLALEDLKLKASLPAEYRFGVENGQGLYNFGLTVQLLDKVDGIVPTHMAQIIRTLAAGDSNRTKAEGIKKAAEAGDKPSYGKQVAYVMNGMTNALTGYMNPDLPNLDVNSIYYHAKSIEKNKLYSTMPQNQRVQFQALFEQIKSRLTPQQVKKLDGQYVNPNSVIPAPPAPGEKSN